MRRHSLGGHTKGFILIAAGPSSAMPSDMVRAGGGLPGLPAALASGDTALQDHRVGITDRMHGREFQPEDRRIDSSDGAGLNSPIDARVAAAPSATAQELPIWPTSSSAAGRGQAQHDGMWRPDDRASTVLSRASVASAVVKALGRSTA
jgi:hypothetical protein